MKANTNVQTRVKSIFIHTYIYVYYIIYYENKKKYWSWNKRETKYPTLDITREHEKIYGYN